MKLVRSNGRTLEVRDVGEISISLGAMPKQPLPILDLIEPDDAARTRLRALMIAGFLKRGI